MLLKKKMKKIHEKIAQVLIQNDCDIHEQGVNGRTPLIVAAHEGKIRFRSFF